MTRFRLLIPSEIVDQLRQHAEIERPRECCGLLAGRILQDTGIVSQRFAIRNESQREDEYETCARDLLTASKSMRQLGIRELAIYHSHPYSRAVPSRKDLQRNTYGESVVHVILGFPNAQFELRAWWLGHDSCTEAEWAITDAN